MSELKRIGMSIYRGAVLVATWTRGAWYELRNGEFDVASEANAHAYSVLRIREVAVDGPVLSHRMRMIDRLGVITDLNRTRT